MGSVVSGGSSVDMGGERCPYKYLGVERGCSAAEAQKAYRRLAMIWHPDRRGARKAMNGAALPGPGVSWGILISGNAGMPEAVKRGWRKPP